MPTVKLKNDSTRTYINSTRAKRKDGAIIPLGTKVLPGQESEFDPDNESVKIAAIGGELKPAGSSAAKWLDAVKKGRELAE